MSALPGGGRNLQPLDVGMPGTGILAGGRHRQQMEQRILKLAELKPVKELMQARGEQVKVT
jgi:hypothetical protein